MKNLLILLFTFSVLNLTSQIQNNQNYIEVIGKSELIVAPNKIYLKILLSDGKSKVKIDLDKKEKKMIDVLRDLGIDRENLVVKDLSSHFKHFLFSQNKLYYSKEYQLLISKSEMVGEVFKALSNVGITKVSIEKLDHSDMIGLRKKVKIDAIKAAREKAIYLAAAIGQDIGKAIHISETGNYYMPLTNSNSIIENRNYSPKMISSSNMKVPMYNIDYGKIKIESSIMCRFELK